MTPIDYIRVDADILKLKVSDKAKFLLGLVKSFNNKGLMMSNPELGELLNCSSNSIKRALKEIEENVRIENPQSRYRRIFYSCINEPVETKLQAQKCTSKADSTGSNTTSTGSNAPRTGANMSHITKGTKKTEALQLACLLFDEIRKRKPDYKKPDLKKWASDIDLMIRRDHRKPERIAAVIRWCQNDSGNGEPKWRGWQNNILSTRKLREKFDKLDLDMQKESPQTATVPFDKEAAEQRKRMLGTE